MTTLDNATILLGSLNKLAISVEDKEENEEHVNDNMIRITDNNASLKTLKECGDDKIIDGNNVFLLTERFQ